MRYSCFQRLKEIDEKFSYIIEKILGDEVNDMYYLSGLATAPSSQRKGYGTALVAAVSAEVCILNFFLKKRIINIVHKRRRMHMGVIRTFFRAT